MKVLFSGYWNPYFMAVTDYIEIALKELGHEVHSFDYRSYVIPGRLRDRIPALERWDRARLNARLRALARKLRPDLFLVNGGHTLEPATIRAAHDAGAVTALWTSDYPLLIEIYLQLAPHYDFFFGSGSDSVSEHRAAGNDRAWRLPFGCLPDLHKPVRLDDQEMKLYGSDVFFAGTAYPDRITLLQHIARLGVDLAIWGPGWDSLPQSHPLRRHVRGGPLRTEQYVKAASACKIAFNHIGTFGHPEYEPKVHMANSRLFELLGCGAFQLTDVKQDVCDLFASGRELVLYHDHDVRQLLDLTDYYLRHDDERRAIGQRARESAVARHTYRHRLSELIGICGLAGRK